MIGDENCNASIVQELYAPKSEAQQAYLEVLDVTANQNSQIDMITLQAMEMSAVNFSSRAARIGRDDKMDWYLGLFGSYLSRFQIDNHLNGAGATAHDTEVIFGNKNQSFDLAYNLIHNASSTIG